MQSMQLLVDFVKVQFLNSYHIFTKTIKVLFHAKLYVIFCTPFLTLRQHLLSFKMLDPFNKLHLFYISKKYLSLKKTSNLSILPIIFITSWLSGFGSNTLKKHFRYSLRVNIANKGFFFKTDVLGIQARKQFLFSYLSFVRTFIKSMRFWLLPLVLGLSFVYYNLIIRSLPLNKIVFIWVAFFMIFYWLVSGFVFFIKKYQYGKFTSAVQRFWKRSYILFWLLESCLLLVFIYLTFVSSQESYYMFDQIQIYKTHLFSWRIFILKIFPVLIIIFLVYFLLLSIKWTTFSKQSPMLLLIFLALTYVISIEFYQFFHIINFYGNLSWVYDVDAHLWTLELDVRKTRTANHYFLWLLILKFWHLLFVYGFWIFFMLRALELKRVRYPLLAANYQNIMILYIMNWLIMYPWIKIYFRKFMDLPYIWFYSGSRSSAIRMLFNDIKVYHYAFVECLDFFSATSKSLSYAPFFNWRPNSKLNHYTDVYKNYIKDTIFREFENLYWPEIYKFCYKVISNPSSLYYYMHHVSYFRK